jgi:dipeptidyl aminopeptidase/acylaminoacyl peptidase
VSGYSAYRISRHTGPKTQTSAGSLVIAKPAAPKAVLNPLTIEAIRERSYPGSALTVMADHGDQGGYHNYTDSFVADGLTEYALVSVPDGTTPSDGWPVIILSHGYYDPAQYTENEDWYTSITAALAQAGYVVIEPDFRGNAQSQGQPEGGHFSPVYTYDVMNLIASIKHDPSYNPKRIGQLGHSMGGDVALHVMVVSKDIKATAFMNGVVGSMYDIFYNWPGDEYLTDQPLALVQGIRLSLINQYGTPQTNPAFWNSVSAINYVNGASGAVLVNQDVSDTTVPKLFADHLVTALQQVGKPVEYITYPGNDHLLSKPTNRAELIKNLLTFYKANL